MAIDTLLPKKLEKSDASYKSVIELNEALSSAEKEHIRNIALTGPFGSGKSSVLITLREDFAKDYKFLPISLATLQANEEDNNIGNSDGESDEKEREKRIESLNRKIEYSILQQLIYREKTETVPNSRFRKIVHLSKWELVKYPVAFVLTFLCILIVFEPSFAKVDSIYDFFSWGNTWNTVFDFAASIWLLFALYKIARYVFKSYSNSKLNKLNLKDGEIEVIENNSIFNKHLDEILYFFQVTDYDVVIIEDLDRFGTPNIFLKLRELNQLINESKIVGRHITFIYAIKDDIFKDEERTKFFDFIITVIPVINPSNSKDKLKSALEKKGCGNDGISDDDLSEMAFFIQDMRILTNIVNEYKQYRDKLCEANNYRLNKTKLLGMIVYKNYYPQDFASLHRREGKVYRCISSKPKFILLALKAIEKSEEELSKEEKIFIQDINLSKADLRRLFLFNLWHKLSNKPLSVRIENNYYSLEQIASSEMLFLKLINGKGITYQYRYYYNNTDTESKTIDFKQIDSELNYFKRIDLLEKGIKYFPNEHRHIQQERIKVKSLRLKDLIKKYKLGETEEFKSFGLPPMMNVFIRRGYLDEDYYDYISYFYEGMVSLADRELLLSMKIEEGRPYDYHIDKIENFVKELKDYMFESDAILNIDLLDYVASHGIYSEMFEHMMIRLECDNAPLQFISQYYSEGKQQCLVFKHFIEYTNSWKNIINWGNDNERENLIEAYLKFCPELSQEQQGWLNGKFRFLVEHCDNITLEQSLKLASASCFVNLCDGSDDLLDYVIEHNCYEISLENMLLIARHLYKGDKTISAENLNYTRIKATENESFVGYVRENISTAIQCLKDENKDENSETLMFLLTNDHISSDVKVIYLTGQHNHIDSFGGIEDKEMYDIAVESKIILPTWENVSCYYDYKNGINEWMKSYINHYATKLSNAAYPNDLSNKEGLFVSLFGSEILEIDNYRKLLRSFSDSFSDVDKLKNVGQDRLMILAENGRLSCNADTIASLLADISKNESLKLELVVYVITAGLDNHSIIAHLVASIEGDYHEVCNQDKRTKLPDNILNRRLLEALKNVGFISSYKVDKDKLQIYHKMKNN